MAGSLEALIQHLVPTTNYHPDVSIFIYNLTGGGKEGGQYGGDMEEIDGESRLSQEFSRGGVGWIQSYSTLTVTIQTERQL